MAVLAQRWNYVISPGSPAIALREAGGRVRTDSVNKRRRRTVWSARRLNHCPTATAVAAAPAYLSDDVDRPL